MPIHSTLGYITSILAMLLLPFASLAQEDEDSTAKEKAIVITHNQLTIAADIFQPIVNSFSGNKKTYEIGLDYALPKEIYAVLEGGFGTAQVNYTAPDLRYTSSNSFFRLGVNKSMLQRQSQTDWDVVFIGLRYAVGFINRSDAFYTIDNQYFGNVPGMVPGKNLLAHWIEITGGMRVELLKHFNAGYNVRAKFLANPKAFKELAPHNIAGFGKGEKTAIFDFNVYLSYSLRWSKKAYKVTPSGPPVGAPSIITPQDTTRAPRR